MEFDKSKLMTVKNFLEQGYLFEEGDLFDESDMLCHYDNEDEEVLDGLVYVGEDCELTTANKLDYGKARCLVIKAKCLGEDYPNNYDPVTKKIKHEETNEIVTYEKVTFKTLFDALNCKYELVEEVDHYPATEKYIANRYLNSLQGFTDFTLYKKVTVSRKQQFVTDCQAIAGKYLLGGADLYKHIYDKVVLPMIKEVK